MENPETTKPQAGMLNDYLEIDEHHPEEIHESPYFENKKKSDSKKEKLPPKTKVV